MAHLSASNRRPTTLVRALIGYLANAGLDADEIRATKPYIRRFIDDVTAGRETSMHQAAARYWNEIAKGQSLATTWAKQMFSLPQSDLDEALESEEKRLTQETNDPVLAAAYLKVMPLLWEQKAISNFLLANPSLRTAMPPIERERGPEHCKRRLSASQTSRLALMLETAPTATFGWRAEKCSVVNLEDLSFLPGFIDGPNPFDPLKDWEQHLIWLQSMPPFRFKYDMIREAQRTIAGKQREQRTKP